MKTKAETFTAVCNVSRRGDHAVYGAFKRDDKNPPYVNSLGIYMVFLLFQVVVT
jgi:hypothetical protein